MTRTDGEFDLRECPLQLREDERLDGLWPLLEKYIKGALVELGDPWSIDYRSAVARKFDAIPFNIYLREQGASDAANSLLEWPWANSKDDRISFLWTLREIAYESQESTRSKIVGGNDRLPRAFASSLKNQIHFNTPVIRIEQDTHGVRAIARTKSGEVGRSPPNDSSDSLQRLLGVLLFAIGDANARNDVLLLEYVRRQRTGYLQRTI